MIYLAYIITAVVVVYLSNKASEYVDLIDQKTSLSGAFIGGVMLSAVTSLPELFTSVSSTLLLNKPGLCIGNILGSNLFNIAVLALLMLAYYKALSGTDIARSHTIVSGAVTCMYLAIFLNRYGILNFQFLTISITSIIIIVLYVVGVKYMSSENGGEAAEEEEEESDLTLKQIIIRFAIASIGLIVLSIVITYITDLIAVRLNLGTGLAGALLLGIATSLPEVSSTFALFKRQNYNIAIGNIIGSNLFNFLILGIVDILYIGSGVYDFSDPKTVNLLVFGTIAMPLMLIMLLFKNKATQIICPLGIIACYLAFLLV